MPIAASPDQLTKPEGNSFKKQKPEGSKRIREDGELAYERTRKRGITLRSVRARGAKQAAPAVMAESSHAAAAEYAGKLHEDVMEVILARMPAKLVLLFRATCKFWCRRASERDFLLAHHHHQPAQPLLCSHLNIKDEDEEDFLMALYYYCLEAIDLRVDGPRRILVRFKDVESIQFNSLAVHGSCDGLLLLRNLGALFVCNLATRQWARLPPLPRHECRVAGFYAHAASGEYRVLYLCRDDDIEWKYYVLTVGSQQQARCIERRASSDSVAEALATGGLVYSIVMPPVLLHGSLQWPLEQLQDNIWVFDTTDESFRWMRPPDISKYSKCFLFETKEGKLALSSWDQDGWMVDLWIMQDYENEVWAFAYKIQVPMANRVGKGIPLNVTIVSQYGDTFVEVKGMVLHYDKNGSLLQTLSCDGPIILFTRYFLKESLVQHPFFHKQQNDDPEGPPFFKGLQSSQ